MKGIFKKAIVMLILAMLLLNSSLLIVISSAIDAIATAIDETKINTISEMDLEKYINYTVGEDRGTLVQLKLKTGVEFGEGQDYVPIAKTGIVLNLPKIEGEYPSKVELIGMSTKATNGDNKGKDIQNTYNSANGELVIETFNNGDNKGNIYTEKVDGARDEYRIILYYGAQAFNAENIQRKLEIKGNTQITFANKEQYNKKIDFEKAYDVAENISGIVSADINTSDIYNGAIKANKDNGASQRTEYIENVSINPSYRELSDKIQISFKNTFIDDQNREIETDEVVYKSTKIDKNEVLKQLGEEGYLQILNENGEVLGEVNKDTQVEENGIVEINYENEISKIIVKTSKIKELNGITIQNIKQIKETMANTDIHRVQVKSEISCTDNEDKEIYNFEGASIEEIKNAETRIDVSIDKTEFTNNVQNDVIFTADLITDKTQFNLFKNPVIEIKLPEETDKVILGELSLLYSDNLKIANAEVVDRDGIKIIRIAMEGTQSTYNLNSMISGPHIVIPAAIIMKRSVIAVDTSIEVTYTNESGFATDYANREETSKKIDVRINSDYVVQAKQRLFTENSNALRASSGNNELELSSYAQVGSEIIKNGDKVKENEVIKYVVQVKNTSNNDISDIKISAQVPEGTNYATVNRGSYYRENYEYIENAEKRTIETDGITLKAGEIIEKYYEVVVKELADGETQKSITNNVQLLVNNQVYANLSLENTIENANVKAELKSYIGRSGENTFSYWMNIYNLSDADIHDIYVETSEFQKELDFDLDKDISYISNGFDTTNTISNKKFDNRKLSFKVGTIKKGENLVINFNIFAKNFNKNINEQDLKLSYTATVNNEVYRSNENLRTAYPEYVTVSMTSDKEGEELQLDEEINYTLTVKNESKIRTNVTVTDFLPEDLKPISLEYDKYELKEKTDTGTTYDIEAEENLQTILEKVTVDLTNKIENQADVYFKGLIPAGKTITFNIKAKAGDVYTKKEIGNFATVTGTFIDTKVSNTVKSYVVPKEVHTTEPDDDPNTPVDPDKPDNPNKPDDPNNNNKPDNDKKYSISGCVWEDSNKNGKRESDEKLLPNINVKLFNMSANSMNDSNIIQTKLTDDKGEYTFTDLPIGNYIVVFEYDSTNYKTTAYQKTEVSGKANSDATTKEIVMNDVQKTVGMTDTINLQNSNVENIDLGLIKNEKFDFKIDKYVSSAIVTNNKGAKEYTFNDSKLAKLEVDRKQMQNTTIQVVYDIVVTNNGEVDGFVNEIVDMKPDTLDFIATENNGWTLTSNNNLVNTSLTGITIKPGESKTVQLVLTKKLSSTSVGTIKNTAQLNKLTNIDDIKDMDVTNNSSEAEIIISVKTGLVKGISIGMVIAILVVILAYCIKHKKISSLMMIIIGILILSNVAVIADDTDPVSAAEEGLRKSNYTKFNRTEELVLKDNVEIPKKLEVNITGKDGQNVVIGNFEDIENAHSNWEFAGGSINYRGHVYPITCFSPRIPPMF